MKFSSRVVRIATIAWALYLTVALTAFALHIHSSHENGDRGHHSAPTCALCIGHNITGAVAAVAAFVLVAPALVWRIRLWTRVLLNPVVAPVARLPFSRGPPTLALAA